MSVGILIGTNRENAVSETIAKIYAEILSTKGIEAEIIYLKSLPEDFAFSALYKHNGKNEGFNAVKSRVQAHSKLFVIVPEYNGSFAGVLKTFIDGMPYPKGFEDKKIALVGVSSGIQGGALALSHLNDIFSYLNAQVLAQKVKLMQIEKNLVDGKIINPLFVQLIEIQINKFLDF
ncbi:MAG: NAD(P)H-dependent oxidoreductase [Thermonemataceae bacterium]|nr:NAD(P)H-dependent oxidoreductase [Thermonemataceae bacterium]